MYVGKMSKSVKSSRSYMGSGKLIKKAIKKYGKDNFLKDILEENIAKDELSLREIFWIKKLNTKIPCGYNLTDGGEGTLGIKKTKQQIEKHRLTIIGKKASEETREKMRNSKIGKKKSYEHSKNISKGLKGRKLSVDHVRKVAEGNRGKKLSEEHKRIISDFHKGRPTSEETKTKMSLANKDKVKLQQLNLDGVVINTFESITEAVKKIKASRSAIYRCLNGERKTHKNSTWKKLN
jgi:group I intron endonuclease